jgi:hypothetical protein
MKRFLFSSLLLPLALTGIGCGDDLPPPTSYEIEVRFQSIILAAIDRLRFRFQPEVPQRFESTPLQTLEGGAITVESLDDGQLEVLVDGAYVRDRAFVVGGFTDAFRLPIYLTEADASQSVVVDPQIAVGVIRQGLAGPEVLGEGRRFVPWPVPNGTVCDESPGMCVGTVTVPCRMGFSFQCRNEDPPASFDAGPPPGDGG